MDYFAPALGSSTTSVIISAVRGPSSISAGAYLLAHDGHHIHHSGRIWIEGHHYQLTCADFSGFPGKWTEEQVTFQSHGWFWRLTVSYDRRYAKLRKTMVKMLHSFKAH